MTRLILWSAWIGALVFGCAAVWLKTHDPATVLFAAAFWCAMTPVFVVAWL